MGSVWIAVVCLATRDACFASTTVPYLPGAFSVKVYTEPREPAWPFDQGTVTHNRSFWTTVLPKMFSIARNCCLGLLVLLQ